MPKLKKSFFLFFLWIVLLNFFSISVKLPLHHEEPRRAIIAQEMLISGSYLVPTVYGEIYNKKPPLQNWFIALFGYIDKQVSNLDARLPSIIAAMLVAVMLYLYYRRRDENRAIAISLVTITTYSILFTYGWKSEPDMLLTLWVLGSYLYYIKNPTGIKNIAVSSVFMGLGILTKGVSFVYFYPGMLLYGLFYKGSKAKFFVFLILHFFISFIIPLIWFYLAVHKIGINPLIAGYSSEVAIRIHNNNGFLDYISHLLIFPFRALFAFFPWSFLIVVLLMKKKRIFDRLDAERLSSILIFFATILIFTLTPGGDGRYLLPAASFLAIFLTPEILDIETKHTKLVKYLCYAGLVAGLICSIYTGNYLNVAISVLTVLFVALFLDKRLITYLFVVILVFHSAFVSIYMPIRISRMYDYENAARLILQKTGSNNNFILDNNISPIQLVFYLERLSGKIVYRKNVGSFSDYILISGDPSVQSCSYLYSFHYSKELIPEIYIYSCLKSRYF